MASRNFIQLENAKFYAFHGYYEEEQKVGGSFVVNLSVGTDFNLASEKDNLADTIDYVSLYEIVKLEMAISSKLLENVGQRIISSIKNKHTSIKEIKLKITKLSPPISGDIEGVSILIEE